MYGKDVVTSDPMEAGYFGVYFWKQAVEKAQSIKTDPVRNALKNQSFNAPEGIVYINKESQQTWELARIGKIRSDMQFTILWSSQKAIRPMPYPPFRSVKEWLALREKIDTQEAQK